MVNEVKAETGAKGKELFHPIRLMITGSHSGPDFDKVIPIIEEGSHLDLPKHVLSVRERVEAFAKARKRVARQSKSCHSEGPKAQRNLLAWGQQIPPYASLRFGMRSSLGVGMT